jgi:hypothetical protein
MPTLAPALQLSEGLFFNQQGRITVQMNEGPVLLDEVLEPYKGRLIELGLHHLPPTPPLLREPGFGSCMWSGHCPCGHNSNPSWIYTKTLKGVLGRSRRGKWTVGVVGVPFQHYMVGHLGRLVVYVEGEVKPDASVDDLLTEAESLLGVLHGLRQAVKDEVK